MAAEQATTEMDAATLEQELGGASATEEATDTPAPAKAEKAKKDSKKSKKSKKKSDEQDEPGDGARAGDGPSLAGHPRAVRSVARSKSWGGLVGFLLAGYLSLPTSTIAEAGLRALAAGVICYVASWAGAVFFWRRFVILEIKAREQQLITAMRAGRASPDGAGGPGGERARARGAS
jgi:hypothetical protein